MQPESAHSIVSELCAHGDRYAGTDAERRAAGALTARLRAAGRRVEVEATYVHPGWLGIQGFLCAVALAGSLVGRELPEVGFAAVFLAATLTHLELNSRLYAARSVLFRRSSQNVVARRPGTGAERRVLLCAGYDAPRAAAGAAARFARLGARAQRALRVPIGPARLTFWSMALLLPVLGARAAGMEAEWLDVVQLPQTLVLLIAVFGFVEAELSEVTPGANDNASGVAAALLAAERLDADPPSHLDVEVVFTGGGAAGEGMRRLLRRHRDEWSPQDTTVIAFDACGTGDVRFERSAGWTVSYPTAPRLLELCEAVADADRDGADTYRAAAIARGTGSDALPARVRRYPATAIGCRDGDGLAPNRRRMTDTPERVDPSSIVRAAGFAVDLVRALDADARRTAG